MLSQTAEHALRALALLASLPEGKTMLCKELAEKAAVPPNYLSKILWVLGNAGIIAATRGYGGGYRLRRPPNEIRLLDIVELFDRTRSRSSCLLGWYPECSDARPCPAHAAWKGIKEAYLRFLETTTIAEIAQPPECDPAERCEPRRAARSNEADSVSAHG